MAPAGGGNIKVVVRVRPFNKRELDRRAECIVQMKGAQTILCAPAEAEERMRGSGKARGGAYEGQKTFAFDKSYWSFSKADPHFAGQDDLHADLGKPLLDNAFQGYNNCIFAYGQTGSGKSYSMMGYGEEKGVIPKICQDMFDRIVGQQKDEHLACTVEVSYLEIYNERVRDLLNPATKGNLKVREHPSTGPYVEDLAKLVVRSFAEIENLMDEGNKARTVAATNMNETSSRSHAVFTITLTQKRHDVETKMNMEKVAKISLVDLAGSERATSTGATGARLKEGAEINRSLSTLGRVIAALADLSTGKKKGGQVPYRDSVLTWLLKDSLGGNSMTAMIAAISPADINFDETLGTLRYADSAKRIKNHAVVNEDANARMIRELKEELSQLRSKLGGGGGGGSSEETYASDVPLEKQFVSITGPDGQIKRVSKAEIAEQLSQSEKLYTDLNQTWEQKLQKTEDIHREREAALEELGISIEKGFVGLHTPKKMPHLVNLSDDPLLTECLVYNLKPGTTTVGNVETATTSEIRLNGSHILHDHCTFDNRDNVVTVIPNEGAAVMVNGIRIDAPKRLRSGFRIILGDFHIFRFNHPQEARAERAEQSLLRHSFTASQLGSPMPRPIHGHERSASRTDFDFASDNSRAVSPIPGPSNGRDSDWSMARREAAGAILGPDQKIAHLTDEELDLLFDDVQRVRAVRKGRPDSRLELEDDDDSSTSYPIREKYLSSGTIDNFSVDTAITLPSTPQHGEIDDRLRSLHEEMQIKLDQQKIEYQKKLQAAETANVEVEEIRLEKERMEESLKTAKAELQQRLAEQKEAFEARLLQMGISPGTAGDPRPEELSEKETAIARSTVDHWQRRHYVRMAETTLRHAALLKQAQALSQEMNKNVVFQFVVVDVGHTFLSSYDLVLNGIAGEDDASLDGQSKPCVGVRVVDFERSVIHLWSLEKLQHRVRLMRQLCQYLDRPEYLQHFNLGNPFSEPCLPQYSLIGDADIPLVAVFESRVQDFSLDVTSPYTSSVVGIVKLSLEPSSAEAPPSTLKFNVVMHDMVGFAEREGTDVHAQLFIPGISEDGGATTTQTIRDFDEGPVRFESVHSMSVPLPSPRATKIRVAIYAQVRSMHLDKLLSWDDMRDSAQTPTPKQRKKPRISEAAFHTQETHDVFARVQLLELTETGDYCPVEVTQQSHLDPGTYQLHQGLQRRIVLSLTHSSGDALQWQDVVGLRIGDVRLISPSGHTPDVSSPATADIPLRITTKPSVRDNADGTSNVTVVAQWDSSQHASLLLDRTSAAKYRIRISFAWQIISARLSQAMSFSLDLNLQIQHRSYNRTQSLLVQLWSPTRILHSTTGIFALAIRPTSTKRAADLWRMNTEHEYVKGEEYLVGWVPRGVSLIRDYLAARKRRHRVIEIETARGLLSARALSAQSRGQARPDSRGTTELQERERLMLSKFLDLWTVHKDPGEVILGRENTEPPTNGTAGRRPSVDSPREVAEVQHIAKNPSLLKSGYVLMPDERNKKWVRRYLELRRPYLHVHSVPDGDELNAINLGDARVDHDPEVGRLIQGQGREGCWAVYARNNTFLFKVNGEAEKVQWIWGVDRSFLGGSSSGSGSGSGYASGSGSEG